MLLENDDDGSERSLTSTLSVQHTETVTIRRFDDSQRYTIVDTSLAYVQLPTSYVTHRRTVPSRRVGG